MFLIGSLGCRAVYVTLLLCVIVDITALYRKMLKNLKFSKGTRHFSLFTAEHDNLSVGSRILCKKC